MGNRTDKRQIKTNLLLRQTLYALMEEKRADAITVTDIASRANINRGTFYLHYRDVADMMERLKQEMFERISEVAARIDPAETMAYVAKGKPYPAAVSMFELLLEHADFFKAFFGPNGDMSFVKRFKGFMTEQLYNKLTYMRPPDDNLLIPRDYLVAYISSANFGIVMHWIESGMELSAEEMGQIMPQLLNFGPLASSRVKRKPPSSGGKS